MESKIELSLEHASFLAFLIDEMRIVKRESLQHWMSCATEQAPDGSPKFPNAERNIQYLECALREMDEVQAILRGEVGTPSKEESKICGQTVSPY